MAASRYRSRIVKAMPNAVSIDPGYAARGEGNALAFFERGYVVRHCFERYVKGKPRTRWPLPPSWRGDIVAEKPQQDGRTWKSTAKVPINLAWEGALIAGSYAGRFRAALYDYTPDQWKGSESKPSQHHRMWHEVLTEDERQVLGGQETEDAIEAACVELGKARGKITGDKAYAKACGSGYLMHNILDAVTLGCIHLGRMKKAGAR